MSYLICTLQYLKETLKFVSILEISVLGFTDFIDANVRGGAKN